MLDERPVMAGTLLVQIFLDAFQASAPNGKALHLAIDGRFLGCEPSLARREERAKSRPRVPVLAMSPVHWMHSPNQERLRFETKGEANLILAVEPRP